MEPIPNDQTAKRHRWSVHPEGSVQWLKFRLQLFCEFQKLGRGSNGDTKPIRMEQNTKDDLGMISWKLRLDGKGSDQSKAWLIDFVVYL